MDGKRYAILIGNSQFPNEPELPALRCPEQDVTGLQAVLSDPERGRFQVTALIDKPRQVIENQLESILNQATKEDTVLIYFSGHGKPSNLKGKLYLAAQDTQLKLLKTTAIAAGKIKELIDETYCNRIILILDCCFSGAIDGEFLKKGDIADQVKQTLTGLSNDEAHGIHIMTACADYQTAEEKQGEDYSVFTKHLIGGLVTGDADKHAKGFISFNDVFTYIQEQANTEKASQKPQVFNLGGGDLLIAHSGKTPRKQQVEQLEDLLNHLYFDKRIDLETLHEAIGILKTPLAQLSELQQQREKLVNTLYAKEISAVEFTKQWVTLNYQPPERPKAAPARKAFEPETRLISGGAFTMGSPQTERERGSDEQQHEVRLSPFYMGVTTVTNAQFAEFVKATGYQTEAETGDGSWFWTNSDWKKDKKINWRNPGFKHTDEHPVVCVSWNDTQAYMLWLNQVTSKGYRLPTEAEWEYACRAGTAGPFSVGDTITPEQVNFDGRYPYADGAKGLYRGNPVPVKSLSANGFGLYEMHGNVWEWCHDWYGDYPDAAVTDPTGPAEGANRVLRGGSWNIIGRIVRSAYRGRNSPDYRNNYIGFRLALGQTAC